MYLKILFILLCVAPAFGGTLKINHTPPAGESLITEKCQFIFISAIQDPADITPPTIYVYRGGSMTDLQYRLTERFNLTADDCGITGVEEGGNGIEFSGLLTSGPWTWSFEIAGS